MTVDTFIKAEKTRREIDELFKKKETIRNAIEFAEENKYTYLSVRIAYLGKSTECSISSSVILDVLKAQSEKITSDIAALNEIFNSL